jgi:BirA family biotin operon repressor/biotin-[acetyl-CoA-carboxylase] ligase
MDGLVKAYQLLKLLSDGEFHSNETLSNTLNLSRDDVWHTLQQLIHHGVQVETLMGKGHRIPHGIELLQREKIDTELSDVAKNKLAELILLEEVDSTSDYLLANSKSFADKNVACFAEYQTQGRGRHGKRWIAPYGTNIYFSLLWHFAKTPTQISGLSLAIAITVTMVLERYGIKEGVSVKWPNDVLYYGRKLGGILLDVASENHNGCIAVIGIGLNTHMPAVTANQIDQPWTDIQQITHSKPKRNYLAGLLLNELIHSLLLFTEQGLVPFLPAWRHLDRLIGKTVSLEIAGKQIRGIMQDISDKGELILLDQNNQEKHYLSGELSLRFSS